MVSSQTDLFRRRIADHMGDPPVVVQPETSVHDAIMAMTSADASAALAMNADGTIRGILTERDVVQRIAGRGLGDRPVGEFVSSPVVTIPVDDLLYRAIGLMRRRGLRHMPVVDEEGAPCGMVFVHDALTVGMRHLVDDIDRLTHEDSLEGLSAVKAAQVSLAEELLEDHVPAPEIQALISDVNNDLHRRVVKLTLAEMEAEGAGSPPVRFAMIVMGSGGRGESMLFPDQDNGLILDDYPDDQHERIDRWFIEFAERVNHRLDELGFPLCNGGVMAINPVWRKTISQWREQVSLWARKRQRVMLQLCDILFDFAPVYGDEGLARALRDHILVSVRGNRTIMQALFEVQAEHRAAIGWFGRFVTESDKPDHKGELNLKHAGTLPLAEGVRLLALSRGIGETGTKARIAELAERGVLNANKSDYLEGAFDLITQVQLRQQIRDFRSGETPSNFVHPEVLSKRETTMLKDAFQAINRFRNDIRADLTGDIF
ncbi:MAG: DUF294 nucleotidyltransferase-like domain-containing protein [Geminicoccaceae bacterium]